MSPTVVIVIGSLNTDIIAAGLQRFPGQGELVYGKQLKIGPGGKSRNIAAMAGYLIGPGKVAMIGRTAEDMYGLYRLPLDALREAGVDSRFIRVLRLNETPHLPAMALIAVDVHGNNQIIVLPGVSSEFDPTDIDAASELFEHVQANNGYLVSTLECPTETMNYVLRIAKDKHINVLLDPGGIQQQSDLDEAIALGIYLLKPNEHEAQILTGVQVIDMSSATVAAEILMKRGVKNVLITHGHAGAYFFSGTTAVHLSVPSIRIGGKKDATGCGDQTMAGICYGLVQGKSLEEAARYGVAAGTLQFGREGIQPLHESEIEAVFSAFPS